MSHWVLTEDVNDYDQYGEYYVCSWDNKPSVEQIVNCKSYVINTPNIEEAEELVEKGMSQQEPGLQSSIWSLEKVYN